jgi:hypothetical protein
MSLKPKIKKAVEGAFLALRDLVQRGVVTLNVVTGYDFTSGSTVASSEGDVLTSVVLLDTKKDETGWMQKAIILKKSKLITSEARGPETNNNNVPTTFVALEAYSIDGLDSGEDYRLKMTITDYVSGSFSVGQETNRDDLLVAVQNNGTYSYLIQPSAGAVWFTVAFGSELDCSVSLQKVLDSSAIVDGTATNFEYEEHDLFLGEGNKIIICSDTFCVENPVDNGYTIECNLRKGNR